jgi:uncharacterized protein (DUF697 family)
VLVGRRGAGKSSVVNALFGAKVAELGHVTAQTGRGRWYAHEREGAVVEILDTRGMQEGSLPAELAAELAQGDAGAASDKPGTAQESIALELRAKPADVVVFVAKASEVDAAIDADLDALERVFQEMRNAHRAEPPLIVVVTHCDLLEPKSTRLHQEADEPAEDVAEKKRHVAAAERSVTDKVDARSRLHDRRVATLGVSTYMSWKSDGTQRADERWRVGELAVTLFRHLPDTGRAEFARAARARAVQEELAGSLTKATAAICAGIAAVPVIPMTVIPLTTLQAGLVAGIAWIGGRSLDRKGSLEFLTSLGTNVGVGIVLREVARAVVKAIAPGAGSIVYATVAFTGTMAIGAAARAYFIRGLSLEQAKRIFRRGKIPRDHV